MKYNCDSNVVGVPFKDKEITHGLILYHPEDSFSWRGGGQVQLATKNELNSAIVIEDGELISKVRFMTTQFYELVRRHDNSDKGLRSAFIKIELRYEKL